MTKRTEYIKTVSQVAATLLASRGRGSYLASGEEVEGVVSTAERVVRTVVLKVKAIKFDDDPEVVVVEPKRSQE